MAGMDLEKIIQELNKRFAAPIPEFYKRRIIFWYDEDKEFEDKIEDITLENANILYLTGNNNFTAKKLLTIDDTVSNYLVYCPLRYDKPEDNWLINIELYSESFRADLYSIWIEEMGLVNNATVRRMIKDYRKFFNNIERRKSIAAMAQSIVKASQLHLAMMASICGLKNLHAAGIIRAVLEHGLELGNNTVYQEMVKYGIDIPFWAMVAQATGYSEGEDANLERLAAQIMLTAATRTMRVEFLAGLDALISVAHQSYCYDLVSDWLRSDDSSSLYQIARHIEFELRLSNRFDNMIVEDLMHTECFPCIDECLLKHVMKDIDNHIINVDAINTLVEKRRTMVWYDKVACYYDGILQVANMQAFFYEHAAGFHLSQARQIWNAYTSDYYKMDTYYRQFHLCFGQSLVASNDALDDLFKQVSEKVEGLYKEWFLNQLAGNWTDVCADELKQYGRILEVAQQSDFYRSRIATRESKVYVIISDALRYEVAVSLADQLRRETLSQVNLESMQGMFPTVTKFGMAALLPHNKLTVYSKDIGGLSVLADGVSTDMQDRDKVLKNAHKNSIALQYKNLIKMKRSDRQELVKGIDVVYIYHDTIDEVSHTADSLVFSACDDAIAEIKNLVRIICNEFGGTRIFITADHGFLYTYSPLTEDQKVDKTSFKQKDIEYSRRYAILEQDAEPEYLLPVKFFDETSGYSAFTPRENIRIKKSGGGQNFVHGGISLQEFVVPVIDYKFLRSSSKTYQKNRDKYDTKPVTVSLLSATRKISNMLFALNFYQNEAVGDNRSACTYQMYFTDENGKQISDVVRIIADKTSENGQERTFRCNFNLKSLEYSNLATYYLVIADESGLQTPHREEFQIDIAFAFDEFNFFG